VVVKVDGTVLGPDQPPFVVTGLSAKPKIYIYGFEKNRKTYLLILSLHGDFDRMSASLGNTDKWG
jgi:hypothetical protein